MKRPHELPPGVKTLRVGDYDMAYVEQGAGTVVVFVHGSVTDYRYFAAQMEPFAKKYRTIAVSLRHYYPQAWNGQGKFSLDHQAADVAGFIRQLSAGPIHLVGHSRGGTVALYATRLAHGLIRSLTLSEAARGMPAFAPEGEGGLEARKANYAAVSEKFNRGDMDTGLEIFTDFINGSGAWSRTPDTVKQWLRDNAWTLLGDEKDQWAPFNCADARGIDVPVLLLGAEKSPPLFSMILDKLQTCLNRVERGLVRNSSHSMPRMNAAGFNEAVMEFIARH